METLENYKTERQNFEMFIDVIGSEIEQAQVKLISAANVQMLLHYWKIGHFILFHQKRLGWGSKVIDKISKNIRDKYPGKKGYSPRNLKYMCQFAKLYPLEILKQMLIADKELETPTVAKILSIARTLNDSEIGQEALAQIQMAHSEENIIGQEAPAQLEGLIAQEVPAQIQNIPETLFVITQEALAQIEIIFVNSPVAKINWASQMVLMDSKLPLGVRYWYMKQSVEFGWSSTILDLQIESGLFQRQIKNQKINNFTATLPKPQSDLANYLLKDPYIFDLAGGKDEIMAQYALEGYNQPIGVSDYQLSKAIPDELKSALPTIEEVERELSYLLEKK